MNAGQKRKKIFFDANPLLGDKSGVGYLTESLILSLAETSGDDIEFVGHFFNFLGRKPTDHLPALPNIRYKQTKLFPTKLLNMLRKLRVELPIELFFRGRVDAYLYLNFVSFPNMRKNAKSIIYIHDLAYIDTPQYVSSGNANFLKNFVPRSIKRASLILTNSEFSRERIETHYQPACPVAVVPIPPRSMLESDNSVFDRHSIPETYMLFVGTQEPRKNLATLLGAYPEIYKKSGVALVLAGGKGWDDEQLNAQISTLREANYPLIQTGYVSEREKTALLSQTVLYVQPSHYEGFGMPILEAMQAGAPVLCSDLAVFREVAGESAAYFDKDSKENLAENALKVLLNKETENAYRTASKEHFASLKNWQQIAQDVRRQLDSIMS